MTIRSFALLGLVLAAAPLAAKPVPRKAGPPQIIPLPLKQIIPPIQRLCTARTASGLGYRVLRAGAGARPQGDVAVTVNYIGYLAASGEVFDQATGTTFALKAVIPGFSEGLALMPAGSIYRFCVPAALGYQDKEVGPIPPNSDLVFQVELLPSAPAATR